MTDAKTLATLILGGAFDATELSDNDIVIDNELAVELQQKLVTTIDDVHIELVARSDYDAQRLRADTAEAELEKLREQVELWRGRTTNLTHAQFAAEQRIAELLQICRDIQDDPRLWLMVRAELSGRISAALNPNPEAESHE